MLFLELYMMKMTIFLKNLVTIFMCKVAVSRGYQIYVLHFYPISQADSSSCNVRSIFQVKIDQSNSGEIGLIFLMDFIALLAARMLPAVTESCKSVQLLCQQLFIHTSEML